MSHWVDQIDWYGTFHQYSAERHEQAHKMNLKDSWNSSNSNLNYLPQVITFECRILHFEIRELNPQALAQHPEKSADDCCFFPSGADLAVPMSMQSYAKHDFTGPQICCDGKHPDTVMKQFWSLIDNTQDTTHHVAIYSGTLEFIKLKRHNKTYILDEQLNTMGLCISHGIMVKVEGLDCERISQMGRCTGSQSSCGGDRWNNCVWEKHCLGRCYGTLTWHLPWQQEELFQIKLLNKDGASNEY